MKVNMNLVMVAVVFVAAVVVSGCGGGSTTAPSGGAAAAAPSSAPSAAPSAVAASDGAALYGSYCAGCHGALATSTKSGITLARLQNAIAGNTGGMGSISLTTAQEQAVVTALTPASSIPPPTVTPPTVTDGPTLYASYCAGCHSALATSTKTGITLARLQNAIAGNTGGMGSISLTTAQEQAIVTALTPASTPPPPVTDGPTLYSNYCASCHGALATSTKGGATSTRIQTAITNNTGGMGSLSTLTATQVSAIATTLAGVTAPTATCGSCHAIPPATGKHAFHTSLGIICATCHGSGYSVTTVNAATHANGVINLTTTIGWNTTRRSCSNSCHGSKSW